MKEDLTIGIVNGKVNIRVAAWIECNNEILVSSFPDGTISLPGGRVKFGEASLEAIVREIREETGETLLNPELFAIIENFFNADTDFHEYLFIYKGTISKKETYEGADKSEQAITWTTTENVTSLKPDCLRKLVTSTSDQGILHLVNVD